MRIVTYVLSIASIVLLSSCAVLESMKCSCCRKTAATTQSTSTQTTAQTTNRATSATSATTNRAGQTISGKSTSVNAAVDQSAANLSAAGQSASDTAQDVTSEASALTQPAVYFDTKKTHLAVSAKNELAKLTAYLKSNPSATVKASAFSDGVGRAELNEKLGELRISSVKQFLQSQGVNSARIQTENRAAEGGAERKVLIQIKN